MAIINKETIISAFDDKMTLVQWLKKLEKVLNTSTLVSINTIKVANTQYKIVLSFEDGTTIESDIIQLQSEIANIQLQNGHLIFTLLNGDTIDAGLIDVSNLGNTTIYGTFEVADGNATFGANVEVDGTLKVNSTLQVGDTITNEDELAKLPRALVTPMATPTKQKIVGVDTANGQNLLNLGQGLQLEGDEVRVGGIVRADEIVENMSGYSFSSRAPTGVTYTYVGAVKNGNKLTLAIACEIIKDAETPYNITFGYFKIPKLVGNKIINNGIGNVDNSLVTLFTASATTPLQKIIASTKTQSPYYDEIGIQLYGIGQSDVVVGTTYYLRYEITFLLSENLAEEVGDLD